MESGDLSGVDERLAPRRRQAVQPHGESIGEQVGESVERIVVVVGRVSGADVAVAAVVLVVIPLWG